MRLDHGECKQVVENFCNGLDEVLPILGDKHFLLLGFCCSLFYLRRRQRAAAAVLPYITVYGLKFWLLL